MNEGANLAGRICISGTHNKNDGTVDAVSSFFEIKPLCRCILRFVHKSHV